jgi:lipopolysaccharide/colanic/teichoic acid biosynthesis glycosyltransferase
VRYDIEYIEKQSLALDIKILWWTFTAILRGKGAM